MVLLRAVGPFRAAAPILVVEDQGWWERRRERGRG